MAPRHLFVQSSLAEGATHLRSSYGYLARLARGAARVTLFLVEDGVLAVRRAADARALAEAVAAGVEVWVDRASMRSRGLHSSALLGGVRTVSMDALADRIAAGERATFI